MEVGATARPPASLRCSPGARWSTGVIMYTLLAGSPPFWHRKQMLMLRMIMSGNYQFGSPEWDDYSDTVKDLVRGWACWLPGAGEGQVQCSHVGVGVGGSGGRDGGACWGRDPGLTRPLFRLVSLRFPASWW